MRRFAVRIFPILLLVVSTGSAAPDFRELGDPAADAVGDLEARLLASAHVRVEATLQATGAVQASLQGFTDLRERNRLEVRYTGTFAGKPVVISMVSDGRLLETRVNDQSKSMATAPKSNRAVLLGLTRMGLLHNLARATGLAGPDHAEGGVAEWISLDNFRPATVALAGEMAGFLALGFDLLVERQFAASAQLWLEPETGLPRRRQQTVEMPLGKMTVLETYSRFVVE